MRVCRKFKFDAAHYLPGYNGKCRNLHGHTWFLEVEVEGSVNEASGFVVDFADLKSTVTQLVIDKFDHTCLNESLKGLIDDTYGVVNPTCECVLGWIWGRLCEYAGAFPKLSYRLVRLRLYESSDSYAELTNYFGEGNERTK